MRTKILSAIIGFLFISGIATATPPNLPPTATNLSAAEAYTEDVALNLIDIVAADVDNANLTVTLTLSSPVAGSLSTATSGAVTSTYNAGTGVWTATGDTADINVLLAGVVFTPAANSNGSFTIATSVSDGISSVTGSKTMTGTAVNDAPTATNLSAAEVYTEDVALNLINIVASDIDNVTVTATLTLSSPSAGSLNTATSGAVTSTYVAGTGVWTASGGIVNVNVLLDGLTFTPATNFNGNFTIATSVTDGVASALTGSKAMTGTAVNDAPTASNLSASETYTEDVALNLTNIVASDVDNGTLTATLTLSISSAGSLNTATSGAVTSVYIAGAGVWIAGGPTADVNVLLNGLTFTPATNFNGNFTISTSISDGALSVTGSKPMTGTAVNDAPLLDDAESLSITVIEDAPIPFDAVGSLVSAFTVGIIENEIGAVSGIAITASDETHGTWYYTLDAGVNWSLVGAVSSSSSLLLPDNGDTRLYFMPSPNFYGPVSAGLTIRAWDQTSGTPGDLVSTTANGGITAFSAETDDISVSVTSVNDAPVLDASGSPIVVVSEDAALPVGTVGSLIGTLVDFSLPAGQNDNVTDVDAGALLGVAITASDETHGTWYYTIGGAWSPVGAVSSSSSLLLAANNNTRLYFRPFANFSGNISDGLTFRAWDQSTGASGDLASTASNGGTTAFSAATDGISVIVTAVNDAPVLDAARSPSITSLEDAGLPVGVVGSYINTLVDLSPPVGGLDNVTDADAGALLGVAIIASDETNGTWYYTLDNGTNWSPLGTVSATSALLLAVNSNTRIYFNPNPDFNGIISNGLTFRAWDQTTGAADDLASTASNGGTTAFSTATDGINVNVSAVNDAPVLDASKSPGLTEFEDAGEPVGVVGASINTFIDLSSIPGGLDNVTDVDAGALTGIAITASDETHGTWYYTINGGTMWSLIGAVSSASSLLLADDGNTRVYFKPFPDFNGAIPAGLTIRAWDQASGTSGSYASTTSTGGANSFSAATDNISVNVNAVNDAPVLDASKTPVINSILEDAGMPVGTVGSYIGLLVDLRIPAGGLDNVTEADAGALPGVAIIASDETNGTWYYTLDDGTNWSPLGTLSATSALLLTVNPNTRIYFKPNPDFNGIISSGLTFRAWDQTTGAADDLASTASNGGTTAFSSATDSISVTVTPVNDAPLLDASASPSVTVSEDAGIPVGAVGSAISAFTTENMAMFDADAGAVFGIAITSSDETNGTWYYTLDAGVNWSGVGAVSSSSALLLADNIDTRLYFSPSPDFNGVVNTGLTICAWDQTSGTPGTLASTTTNGGVTAFSLITDHVTVIITAVNDAPTATNLSASETYTENTPLNLTDIVASDVDNSTLTATLTLSDPAAGSLSTSTSGVVTSTYDAGTGVWRAGGPIADVNTLLAGVVFTPTVSYSSDFSIATNVGDGTDSVTGSKPMTGTSITGLAGTSNELPDAAAYPNPFANQFTLKLTAATSGEITIRIVDITGRLVQELREKSPSTTLTLGADLQEGIYFIMLSQNNSLKTLRVIKTH